MWGVVRVTSAPTGGVPRATSAQLVVEPSSDTVRRCTAKLRRPSGAGINTEFTVNDLYVLSLCFSASTLRGSLADHACMMIAANPARARQKRFSHARPITKAKAMSVVYVAVSGEEKIKCYVPSPTTGSITQPFHEVDCPGPFQLCVSPDGRFLFAVSMGPKNEHVSYGAPVSKISPALLQSPHP